MPWEASNPELSACDIGSKPTQKLKTESESSSLDLAGPGMTRQSGPVFIAEDDFNLAGFWGMKFRGLGGSRFQHLMAAVVLGRNVVRA